MAARAKVKKLGRLLAKLRTEAGLTQEGLAKRAKLPVTSLQGWEQGRREPLLSAAVKLARAIGCSLDELAKAFEPTARKRKESEEKPSEG